jgi:ubiquinol oxidase
LITPHPPTSQSGCGSNMGQISVKTYAATGSLLSDNQQIVILLVQGVFLIGFALLYLVSSRTAHRVVGYFEEEAVISYTLYLQEIDEGRSPNVPAPEIAKYYWQMPADATLRDVLLVIRDDEAHHRDINHGYATKLAGEPVNPVPVATYPKHATDIRLEA